LFFILLAPAPTAIYTLSLHDALPIYRARARERGADGGAHRRVLGLDVDDLGRGQPVGDELRERLDDRRLRRDRVDGDDVGVDLADRKSTRLNSSHVAISYAVFCLKKK